MAKHPMQPIELDKHGTARFKRNSIVDFLLEFARERGTTLTELACMSFSEDDWNQFAQLAGYSVSGFGDLSYADSKTVAVADAKVERIVKKARKRK